MVIRYGEPQTARSLARSGAHLRVICLSATCTHEAVIAPRELIERGYGDIHLNLIERRLKCVRCGAVKPRVHYELW